MPPTIVDLPAQKSFWDEWHCRRGASGLDAPHMELRHRFIAEMRKAQHGKVADLGCGQGLDAMAFAEAGMTVTALDFSDQAIRQVQALAKRRRGIVARRHDLSRQLPFPDRSFDGVYSHLALHYFDDPTTRRIFGEVWRILRPGGPFVFSVKSTDDPYYATGEQYGENLYCRNGHLRHFFSVGYTEELLRDWKVEAITTAEGHYASRSSSAFIQVVAHKPD